MKKKVSFFLVLLTSVYALAQTVTEGAIGGINKYYTYFVVTPEGEYKTMYIWAQSEVTLNGESYRLYTGKYEDGTHVDSVVFIRQEGLKFFCYDTKNATKHLLFDFGLQKGDVHTDNFLGLKYKVTDVRDTIVNKKNLRLIELQDEDNKGKRDIWVESIGSINTGILSVNNLYEDVCLLGIGYQYLFYPSNQYIRTAYMKVTEQIWEGGFETEEDRRKYEEWERAPSDLNSVFIGDTLHVWGRLNIDCDIQSYAACLLKGNQITFKFFSNGDVDCYDIYEVEAYFPGFQRGKYSIKLLNKTVELECTESNYTPVEGITHSPVKQNGNLYDLQGRRLPQAPQKGVYIQNGKKVAVK